MRYVSALVILSVTLASCSSVEKINRNSIEVVEIAQSSKDRFTTIANESRVTGYLDKDKIQSEALAGAKEQDNIIYLAKEVIKTIPRVEDSVPWWASLLQWGFIGTSIVGVLVILWYLGLGYPIKAVMRSFASLIPSKKRQAAKLLVEAQDPESGTSIDEAVAVMRATDKDFNAAYKKQKEKSK